MYNCANFLQELNQQLKIYRQIKYLLVRDMAFRDYSSNFLWLGSFTNVVYLDFLWGPVLTKMSRTLHFLKKKYFSLNSTHFSFSNIDLRMICGYFILKEAMKIMFNQLPLSWVPTGCAKNFETMVYALKTEKKGAWVSKFQFLKI